MRSINVADSHNLVGAGLVLRSEKALHVLASANDPKAQSLVRAKNAS
ncbi:MAG: hypothetical protein JF563_05550 [Acidobacteriales bacterium]|nr:hypothetical protein [Terriglobales bacterium]